MRHSILRNHFIMRQAIILLALCCAAWAAPTVTVLGITQTQAVLKIQNPAGNCTVEVSPAPGLSPLVPDVDPALYAGSNTDTTRPDTITWADGTRIVTVGHMTDDRALAANKTYYYRVSGCGGTATGSFPTPTLSLGTTRTEYIPFNAAKRGNLGYPTFDWTTKKIYVDPTSGVEAVPMALRTSTWRTGCGAGGCASGFNAWTDWADGAAWTNPGNIRNGLTSNAQTGNTNALDLYADLNGLAMPIQPYDIHRWLEDIGAVVYGSGTSATAADRTITLDLRVHGSSCGTVAVTLPTGSIAQVSSGSSDADGAFPAVFPRNPFNGWSNSVTPCIRNEDMETSGTLTVSGSTLTIASPTAANHFSSALVAGDKIWIAGSACTNNLCTIATVSGPGTATVSETPGNGAFGYRAYGWFLRVAKNNASGTVTVGLKYKLAGSGSAIGVQSGGDRCNKNAVTSGDGKTGYLCHATSLNSGFGYLTFQATDGTTRIISTRTNVGFDDTQGNVLYQGATNGAGGYTVNKLTYTGDYTEDIDFGYTCAPAGDCPAVNDHITVVDLMPHSSNMDLYQQIQANQGGSLPAYNTSLYGAWTVAAGTIFYAGSSGHFAFFSNVYSGQGQAPSGGGPGWVAVVNLSTNPAIVTRLIHTLDGTGNTHARFGSLHSAQSEGSRPNTLFLSLDPVQTGSTAVLHGGPWADVVQAVLDADGVTWKSNSALPQLNALDNSYYRTCPINPFNYTECVTIRLHQGGVCNTKATPAEKTNWPCPWNANYSQFPAMAVNDNAVDLSGDPGNFDSEHFKVLSTAVDGSYLKVVLARNAVYDYCSYSPWHGQTNPLAAEGANQTGHANGWTLTMMPGTLNSCGAAVLLQDQTDPAQVQELGHSFAGHFAMGVNAGGNLNFVTATRTIYNTPFASLGQVPPVFKSTPDTSFHAVPGLIGSGVQSYTEDAQFNAGASGYRWALDSNPLVGCVAEAFGCGPLRTIAAVTGDIYKIQNIGSAATAVNYKVNVMQGWAGRYQLQDVSGPSSSVDSTPFSMCFALSAGECHAGSLANEIYINVPKMHDRGYCQPSLSWANNPCVILGLNAPADGIRQFRIAADDSTGAYSRFISRAFTGYGANYPYTHTSTYPAGTWTSQMGTHNLDGHEPVGFMISLPPWTETGTTGADFIQTPVSVGPGAQYAEIRWGYSRYRGNPGDFRCTLRAEACTTRNDIAAIPFNYVGETRSLQAWPSGCTINIPVVGPNILYYQVYRSANGTAWTAEGDIRAMSVGTPLPAADCSTLAFNPTAHNSPVAGDSGSIAVTVTDQACSWTATSNAGWLTIASGGSGTGNGAINWTAANNATASPRTATITAAGAVFTDSQAAPSCAGLSFTPTSHASPAAGDSGSIAVTVTDQACPWTATSSAGWLTITSGSSGTGNGTIAWSVSPNAGATRTATITSQSAVFTESQAGPSAPTSSSVIRGASSGAVTIQ